MFQSHRLTPLFLDTPESIQSYKSGCYGLDLFECVPKRDVIKNGSVDRENEWLVVCDLGGVCDPEKLTSMTSMVVQDPILIGNSQGS